MEFQINFSTSNLRNFSDFVDVKSTHNGREQLFQLTLEELIQTISNSVNRSRAESPLLPQNCIKYVTTSKGYEVYIQVPKNQWMINYNNNLFKVGFPRMIVQYDLNLQIEEKTNKKSYRVQLLRIVAIKESDQVNGDTQLFQFPYSHVDSSSARVCMGGNNLKNVTNLKELENYHTYFIHSPFSNDYGAKVKCGKPVQELFANTFNEKDFDENQLIPLQRTFNDFFGLGISESL